jgi:hypothetical protein
LHYKKGDLLSAFVECGSRSGQISISLADPDLNVSGPISTICKAKLNVSRNFQKTVQNIENFDTYDVDEKDADPEHLILFYFILYFIFITFFRLLLLILPLQQVRLYLAQSTFALWWFVY